VGIFRQPVRELVAVARAHVPVRRVGSARDEGHRAPFEVVDAGEVLDETARLSSSVTCGLLLPVGDELLIVVPDDVAVFRVLNGDRNCVGGAALENDGDALPVGVVVEASLARQR
jgi:hypothetical protein